MFLFKKIGRKISVLLLIILSVTTLLIIKYPQFFSKIFKNVNKQSVTLPEGFPDLPVYPKAELSSHYDEEMEGEIEHKYEATWEINESVPVVMDWFTNSKNNNWKVIIPPFDPGATGAQEAVFEYNEWNIYIVVQKRDISDPTYIYVSVDPK